MLYEAHLMHLYVHEWTNEAFEDGNLKWSLLTDKKEFAKAILSIYYLNNPSKLKTRRTNDQELQKML